MEGYHRSNASQLKMTLLVYLFIFLKVVSPLACEVPCAILTIIILRGPVHAKLKEFKNERFTLNTLSVHTVRIYLGNATITSHWCLSKTRTGNIMIAVTLSVSKSFVFTENVFRPHNNRAKKAVFVTD